VHEQGPICTDLEGRLDIDYAFMDCFSASLLIYKLIILDPVHIF